MKKIYFTLFAITLFAAVQAQEVTRYYLNNNMPTQSKDSATYQVKFTPAQNGMVNFERYCMDGKLKEKGTYQNMVTLANIFRTILQILKNMEFHLKNPLAGN